ncbi:MAG: hypothetical protein ACREN4_02335 [Candidatus Dormibacteria bacterium]
MTTKPKIGVLTMALLEDAYNKTGHMRPQATEAARDVAHVLEEFGSVVHPGLVEDESQAAAAARQFQAEEVDLIVAVELAYTKGLVPVRCLLDTTAPVLVWNTQRIGSLKADDDFDVVMLNSGMAGMPELTAALVRLGRSYALVTSQLDDERGRARIGQMVRAAALRRRLRSARVGLVGHPFEGMTDLMFDQVSLRQIIGPVVWPVEPELVAENFARVGEADLQRTVAGERGRFRVDMDEEAFQRSVRLAMALETTCREQALDAFTAFDQVWLSDPRVGVIPSYGTGRLCELGYPSAPEGDPVTAVAQLVLQELAGNATTMENYVMDFDHDAVMFSHDGHGNPAMGTPGAVAIKHSIYYRGVHGFGAGFEFAYSPGPMTNFAIVGIGDGRWRFVISEGELLPIEPRPIAAPQGLFRHHALGVSEWCDGWLRAGATHHMGGAHGNWTSELLALARMLDVEAVVV